MSTIAIPSNLMKAVNDFKSFGLASNLVSKEALSIITQVTRVTESSPQERVSNCCGKWI